MANKRPILFSFDGGQLGRFVKTKSYGNGNCSVFFTSNFHDEGGLPFAKQFVIENVPEAAVSRVIKPSARQGVPEEGYVFLMVGEFGNTWLADQIGMEKNSQLNNLTQQVKAAKIQAGTKEHEKRELSKGVEEGLRKLDEMKGLAGLKDKRRSGEMFPDEPADI
jgi:hypothetical protein